MWRPLWSSAGSSRSLPGPPWWTRCRGLTAPGSFWSAGPAQPAGWSQPELNSVRSGRPRGLHAVPGSPPESCTSLGLSDPPLHSQTSCWRLRPFWQMSGTSLPPGVKKIRPLQYLPQVIFGSIAAGKFKDYTLNETVLRRLYLSEVLLSLQKFLLASSRVWQQLVPALYQSSVTSFNSFWLNVFGSQQLILQGCNICDALLLKGLQTSIKCLLQTGRKNVSGENKRVQMKPRILLGRMEYLLGEQGLHRGQVSAIVISLQTVFLLT